MRAFPAILLLGFNRPEMMRAQIKAIAPFRPSWVYLAVDGPRPNRPGEVEKCAACAAVLDHPDWPCEVKKLVRTENLGCKRAVEEALDWFFDQENEGIILEDDCRPGPSFLPYAAELLERYRHDARVGMVSGNNFYGFITDSTSCYRFSRHVHIWGWATWARVWRAYRTNPEEFSNDMDSVLRRGFLTQRGRVLGRKLWDGFLRHRDTWDIPFALWVHGRGLLSTMPQQNLVANVGGESGDATHTAGFAYDQYLSSHAQELKFPLVHPVAVECDIRADRLHELRSFAWLPRVLTVVGSHFGATGHVICSLAHPVERLCPALFRV